jgi:hypothetical protein
MMKRLLTLLVLFGVGYVLQAQPKPLTYFLPDIKYDAAIPTPQEFLGYQIGEWHISHDQQLAYMRELARLSPRITLTEYARTYEHRPLVYLTITSEDNHKRLPELQAAHVSVTDPAVSGKLDLKDIPAVLYQGYSIHGNEPSGGNAAPLVAYYLAAAKSPEVARILDEVIILFDPCYNPDGFHRFSTWANMHKNQNLTGDPSDREYNEEWPRGRTNHYWFDLNRDWLPVQLPESQGRIRTFQSWKPNVLTDHHEMGTNATFFFMPGVPQRTHPITPWRNQELTGEIGKYHQRALDDIGSLYYSQEGYDDFYYGKGSTYPDGNGCVGILFEQASSRGHLQETENGDLSFPFTIRNQVATALSTHKAVAGLRMDLLEYQRDFYRSGIDEAKKDAREGYVFGDPHDQSRVDALVEILRRHEIEVYQLAKDYSANGQKYEPGKAFVVPMEQNQYRLIRAAFETLTTFEDSIFYDISSWTLPLAFNLPYTAVNSGLASLKGAPVNGLRPDRKTPATQKSNYAYLLRWDDYFAPSALFHILKKDLRAKVASKSFTLNGKDYPVGTVMIPVQNQKLNGDALHQFLEEVTQKTGVPIDVTETGLTPTGIDLGSRDFEALELPKTMLLVGDGVRSYDAGEVWHLMDERFGMSVVKVEVDALGRVDLSRYNRIVMADGSYSNMSKGAIAQLKDWVKDGGVLVALRGAVSWANRNGLASLTVRKDKTKDEGRRPYDKLSPDRGSEVIGGAIFEAELDLTHPLAYGFHRERMPVFRRGTFFIEAAKNPYATPMMYTDDPLLSGYIKSKNLQLIKGSAAIVVQGMGSGRIICMTDNPNFRAFWYGTNKLFLNALFFGDTISSGAVERVREGKK